jgi:parallel beta-helix repeat protein
MAAHRNHLKENVIENNGQAGIRVRGATEGLIFENNVIRETRTGSGATQAVGVLIEEEAGEVTLSGNEIKAEKAIEDRREKR